MHIPKDLSAEVVNVDECVLNELHDDKGNTIYRLLIKQVRSSAIDYYLSTSIVNEQLNTK